MKKEIKFDSSDPYLDRAMRGWIINHAKRQYWRVAAWYDLADLIQDGFLCYYKCKARYTNLTFLNHPLPEDKRRFMSLVQRAFANHITNLANRRTETPELAISQVRDEGFTAEELS